MHKTLPITLGIQLSERPWNPEKMHFSINFLIIIIIEWKLQNITSIVGYFVHVYIFFFMNDSRMLIMECWYNNLHVFFTFMVLMLSFPTI